MLPKWLRLVTRVKDLWNEVQDEVYTVGPGSAHSTATMNMVYYCRVQDTNLKNHRTSLGDHLLKIQIEADVDQQDSTRHRWDLRKDCSTGRRTSMVVVDGSLRSQKFQSPYNVTNPLSLF